MMMNGINGKDISYYFEQWYEKNIDGKDPFSHNGLSLGGARDSNIGIKKQINQATVKSSRLHLKKNKLSKKITRINSLISRLYTEKRDLQLKAAQFALRSRMDINQESNLGNNIDTNG